MEKDVSTIFKSVPGLHNIKINATGTIANFNGEIRYVKWNCPSKRAKNRTPRGFFTFRRTRYYAAILVARAFIKNPYPEYNNKVIFKDSNPKNCHFSNLFWGTQREIYKERFKNDPSKHFLNYKQDMLIVKNLSNGTYSCDLAKMFSVSHATITRLRKKFLEEKHGNNRYHTEVKAYFLQQLDQGQTSIQISAALGIRYETVWKWSRQGREKLLSSPCGHIRLKDLIINF